MNEIVSRKENSSRRAESTPESVAPSQLKAAPPFQLFAGSEKPAQLAGKDEKKEEEAEMKKSILDSTETKEENNN
jgi:hypothetical protein